MTDKYLSERVYITESIPASWADRQPELSRFGQRVLASLPTGNNVRNLGRTTLVIGFDNIEREVETTQVQAWQPSAEDEEYEFYESDEGNID
jgi:hypothetical protein